MSTLKAKTAASHKRLESLPVSSCILSPDMRIQDYVHYLKLMYDVHHSVEETIFPLLLNVFDDLNDREKRHLIEEDLTFLKYYKPVASPVFNTKKNITIPFASGILYVVEGSSLGGRFILKNIESIQGLNEGKGVSYFSGYGNKTGSYWKTFLNVLTAYEEENNCEEEIIAGAIYAFDCIHDHFMQTKINEN
ncbi:biliverdin-producing heme oxygenase [Flavobacterium sp. MDT1-60]|uniref:biliverdin-producing heme oxygenase n=1 Tax=Flavobacterium sp. MDT1-60 TaxID=1979344 RepID=UPI00177C3D3F|nr:biliverdin-producing heme oxygenase [Flavobacterium sp. MDT1-60]QOG01334.1 biliverdin-producing heme oxygenase [Flavobacterium sp. MDT1-60]